MSLLSNNQMISKLEISKDNLIHNLKVFEKYLDGRSLIIPVVKSNAYGHGLAEAVSILDPYVSMFMVDDINELELIRKHTEKEVFVSGYVAHSDLKRAAELRCILSIYDISRLKLLNNIAKAKDKQIQIHIKVDALIGRQGVMIDDFDMFLEEVKKCKNITVDAIYSHFSDLDDANNIVHAQKQISLFNEFIEIAKRKGFGKIKKHISATSGALVFPELGFDYVRIGIGLYGLWKSENLREVFESKVNIKPVLSWKTIVAQVKKIPKGYPVSYNRTFVAPYPMVIAIIPQGYSDGYPRSLSSIGYVLIQGTKCPVIGRIAMNMFVVDVTHLQDVQAEEEVVLIGCQGQREITASDLAISSINYEVEARLSPLIPRIVV